MIPPLDEEDENEESRLFEAQACKELEDDGCPPYYLPDLEIPVRNLPRTINRSLGTGSRSPGQVM